MTSLIQDERFIQRVLLLLRSKGVCVCVCLCACVRLCVCVSVCACSKQQTVNKYIFLTLVFQWQHNVYIQYSVHSNGSCLSRVPLSCYSEAQGGIVDDIMVSWLMNPWVKKDVNVMVICRVSRDNRWDVVRRQMADSRVYFSVSGRGRRMRLGGWHTKKRRNDQRYLLTHK